MEGMEVKGGYGRRTMKRKQNNDNKARMSEGRARRRRENKYKRKENKGGREE